MHRKYLQKIIVNTETKLHDIVKITNLIGTCFVTDRAGKIVGVVTDGDARRAPLRGFGLDAKADEIMNKNFFYILEVEHGYNKN